MTALSAAIIYGAVKLADYATGAKKAREALQGMSATATNWKTTPADTFYANSGFSFFGLSAEDFSRDKKNATEWMNSLLGVWTDGKYKKKAVIDEWNGSFKEMTATTRESLQEMQTDAKGAGFSTLSDQMEQDIKTLDSMDTEITRLLKRKQSGKFSNKEKLRLQELVDTREAIEIKYKLTAADVDGFETIQQKIEAEIARAQAKGKTEVDASVYEAAVVASAEGMASINTQLDAQYDKEYRLIGLMQDGAEKEKALNDLNARYIENRKLAVTEYAALLADLIIPVWNQDDIQKADSDIDALYTKLREYNLAQSNNDQQSMAKALEDMNKLTAGMDEGKVAEYLALLTQIQSLMDNGMSEAEVSKLFPEVDVTGQMDQIAALSKFLTEHKDSLGSLSEMFSISLPEEILKIATDLDMTGAQTRWDTFAQNPGAITTQAVIDGYTESETVIRLQPRVIAFVEKYTEVPEGASKSALSPQGLVA